MLVQEAPRRFWPELPGRFGFVPILPPPHPTPHSPSCKRPRGFDPPSPRPSSRLGPFRRRPEDRESNRAIRREHSVNEGGVGEKIIFLLGCARQPPRGAGLLPRRPPPHTRALHALQWPHASLVPRSLEMEPRAHWAAGSTRGGGVPGG